MTGVPEPALEWVAEVSRLVSEPSTTPESLVSWAGGAPSPGDEGEVVVTAPAAIPGALDVLVSGEGGVPEAVSAAYDPETGPPLDDAILALGAWHEFTRSPPGPYQGAFDGVAPRGWELVGTLHDPPGAAGRRLVEVALLRS